MKKIELIEELLETGKVSIETRNKTLFCYEDIYFVEENHLDTDDDEESIRKSKNPFYDGKSLKKALLVLKKDIGKSK